MLRRLPQLTAAGTLDDASLWPVDERRSLVSTVDFFAPVVDDARTWGAVAAANAASDVYAMGGRPLFALNIVAWPRDALPLDLLREVLAGGADTAAAGGWAVVGGHSVDGPEPLYGMAVTGEVDTDAALTLAGARVGDVLVLTKPLGIGLVTAAVKSSPPEAVAAGGPLAAAYAAAVAEMTRLNADAAAAALAAGATAATDVTGFGLLGHLRGLATASGVTARVDADAVPLLPDALRLLDAGHATDGGQRNLDAVAPVLSGGDEPTRRLLTDPQTSGGLLFACGRSAAAEAVDRLTGGGHHAAIVGEITGELASPAAAADEAPLLVIEGRPADDAA